MSNGITFSVSNNLKSELVLHVHVCVDLYLVLILIFSKLKRINPGFDKVGKVGADGNPLVST